VFVIFQLRLDNGLPNFICTMDESKINTTIRFFENVQTIDCIQRKVLLGNPSVNKLFPKLDGLELKLELDNLLDK
jgi:hypothetical protein